MERLFQMNLLILPDIFGMTPALERLARDLGAALATLPGVAATPAIEILDPYGNGKNFDDEALAYAYFISHLDIPEYAGLIRNRLAGASMPTTLLGFSAGASAVWHLAGTLQSLEIHGAVCFYGSQIRHFPHLVPGFDIHLIFPVSEPHFDVTSLVADMLEKPGTSCETAPGQHGFMNAFSNNFDQALYDRFIQKRLPDLLAGMTAGR